MSIGKVTLVILATLVIFSSGLITGVVLVKQMPKPIPNPPVTPQGLGWQQFLRRVEGELDLTPEQHQRVAGILRDSQEHARGMAQAEFAKVRDQIRAELTPPQREKFQRLLEERRRRAQEMNGQKTRPFPQ